MSCNTVIHVSAFKMPRFSLHAALVLHILGKVTRNEGFRESLLALFATACKRLDGLVQSLVLDRLGDVSIHPCCEESFLLSSHRMCGQSDDGQVVGQCLFPFPL